MSFKNLFKSLSSTSSHRRTTRHPPPACLHVEALEDRCVPALLAPDYYPAAYYSYPTDMVSADYNNDAVLDLAVGNAGSSSVSVLLGNGNGTFQTARNSATGGGPLALATGDFNGDGKLDLMTKNYYTNYENNVSTLSVLPGNGDGTFQTPITTIFAGGFLAVGDLNGDGKLDLVSEWSTFLDVRLGNGNGTFAAPISKRLADSYVTAVVLHDFNADGKLDVATAGHGVCVFAGNGNGTLADPVENTALNLAAYSLAAGDFNADGNIDLASTTSTGDFWDPYLYTSSVHVLLGYGDGTFAAPRTSTVYDIALTRPTTGDFNGDGFSDLAAIGSASQSTVDSFFVFLNDGSWPAALTINDVGVTEGNSGTVAATFTVRLSPAHGQTVTVHYETAAGHSVNSATAGSDYQPTSGTLTFAPGESRQTITVLVNGDRLGESSYNYYGESFFVVLSNPTNAFVDDGTGVGGIVDDEPTVSIVDYMEGEEGNTGTTPFTFAISLSAAYDQPITLSYDTAELTPDEEYWYYGPSATAGVDYIAASSALATIPAGETSGTITILVNADQISEDTELFLVRLTGATGASISYYSQAAGFIVNDDVPLSVSIGGSGTIVEGNSGTKELTVSITLSAASTTPVTVTYATANGTAAAGSDYLAASGTVTFAPGETSKTITIAVNGDRLGEHDETFYVNLSGATNATIANGQGVGTILDDEPRISISDVTKAEGKKGQTTLFTFTITLSAAYDQPVTMSFRTVNGTAKTSDNDYVSKTGTLTFASGQTTKTITIEVKGDSKREANETFSLDLFGLSGNALFTKNRGLGTILNDD
jgi:hypothetical protein